jgi:hypothetical protein
MSEQATQHAAVPQLSERIVVEERFELPNRSSHVVAHS